jgi:hypothetical protein
MMQQGSPSISGPQNGAETALWSRQQGRQPQMQLGRSCQQVGLRGH